jgi:hypothetical protein
MYIGLGFMSDEDFITYLKLHPDDEVDFFLKKYKPNQLVQIKDAYLKFSSGELSTVIQKEQSKSERANGYIGKKCMYCNSTISTYNLKQFCSVKCEKEYYKFRNK